MTESTGSPEDSAPIETPAASPQPSTTDAPDADTTAVVPAADPSASALVPASPATVPAMPARTGPTGKTRSPFGGWLLLFPTFGIYYLFWYFNINRELRDYDASIKVSPGVAVICLFIPVVGLVSIYNTGSRIRQAQATAGAPAEASGLIGLIAALIVALDVPYYSSQLNQVWQHASVGR